MHNVYKISQMIKFIIKVKINFILKKKKKNYDSF